MSKEEYEIYRDIAKKEHTERVNKTPARIEYAIKQFEKNDIEYELKNKQTGHFHCKRKSDGKLFNFWAGTGKIQGYENLRGILALIYLLR